MAGVSVTLPAHSHLMIDLSSPQLSADERALLHDFDIRAICLFRRNIRDRHHMAEFSQELRVICGDDLILALDQEGGSVARALDVPYAIGNMALGSVDDVAATTANAAATAKGLRAIGINLNLAPVADVNINPYNPVIAERSFGKDPEHVARHISAFVSAHQEQGVACCLKHFPGHGDSHVDSHHSLPSLDVSRERLESVELPPFRAGIAAGAAAVMSYHGVITSIDASRPASLSSASMARLLRDGLGFTGLAVTDALEMRAIAASYGMDEAAVMALQAGNDLALYNVHAGDIRQHLSVLTALDEALEQGRLDPDALTRSEQRLRQLAQSFPIAPQTLWNSKDEALLAESARCAVAVRGELPALEPPHPILFVSARGMVGGSASDLITSPALALAQALKAAGFHLSEHYYDPEVCDDVMGRHETILFASASRTRLSAAESALVERLQARAKTLIHIALWNPYSSLDIAAPSVISYGFHPASLEQICAVLRGATPRGSIVF